MNIGGALNYARLAQLNRPSNPQALQAEVRRLATSQKLTATDISTALRIDLAQVRQMLALRGEEAADAQRAAWKA